MPNVQLYINDNLCDLHGDEQIAVDYSVFDVSKIDSRGGARSYSFNIPKSNRNKQVLENPEMVNSLSDVPYQRLPAMVLVDGVDVLIRFAEVVSAKDSYAINLYGSNSDLFSTLGDLKLFDLDFTEFNHLWHIDNVFASRLNIEGYIYAIIDFNEDSPNFAMNNDNREIRIDQMPPSFFVNTILAKIFETAGYELDNEIEDDTANLIMPLHFSAVEAAPFISKKYAGVFTSLSQIECPSIQGNVQHFAFDAVSGYAGSYYALPYYVPGTNTRALRFEDSMQVKVSISLDITIVNPVNVINIDLKTFYSDGTQWGSGGIIPVAQNLAVGTHTITFDWYPITLQIIQKEIYITIGVSNASWVYGVTDSIFIESTSTVTITDVVYWGSLLKYNQFLNISAVMPDMTQIKFIKNYLLLFGLIPIINEQKKTVYFKTFKSIAQNLSNCYDWSAKLDLSENPEVKYLLDNYAQNNYFKYLQDGSEPFPLNANAQIVINNKNLQLETDLVQLDFSPTSANLRLNDGIFTTNLVPQIGVYKQGEWTNKKNPRLLNLVIKQSTDVGGTINYNDGNGQTDFNDNIPMCYFIDLTQTFNLGFGNNILQNYYQAIADVILRLKIVTLPLRLSAAEISQIDFSRPVWIDKYESYFYISAIKGFSYTQNQSTTVELVKLF